MMTPNNYRLFAACAMLLFGTAGALFYANTARWSEIQQPLACGAAGLVMLGIEVVARRRAG